MECPYTSLEKLYTHVKGIFKSWVVQKLSFCKTFLYSFCKTGITNNFCADRQLL